MKQKNILWASAIGSALEFYEFTLFGFLSSIISKLYFPAETSAKSLLITFGTFAAGFLARPLGGIIFGHVGDRWGRKIALRFSILMMGISTTLIGLLPPYAVLGGLAAAAMILLRIFQGVSAGGEFNGGIILTVEHTDKSKRNFWGSIITCGCLSGMLLGAIAALIVTLPVMPGWAWRVPFLCGMGISLIAFYIRKNIDETPEFLRVKQQKKIQNFPLWETLKNSKLPCVTAFSMGWFTGVYLYVITLYMPLYFQNKWQINAVLSKTISIGSLLCLVTLIPMFGFLSDKYSRLQQMKYGAALLGIISASLAFLSSPLLTLGVGLVMCVLAASFWGPMNTLTVELFNAESRYSGSSVGYSLGIAIFGGTAPLLSVFLMGQLNGKIFFGLYLLISALVGFIGVLVAERVLQKQTLSMMPSPIEPDQLREKLQLTA